MSEDKKQRLAEIEERVGKATSGIWAVMPGDDYDYASVYIKDDGPGTAFIAEDFNQSDEDAEFVAHSHQDVPWLIAELNAAWAREEDALLLARYINWSMNGQASTGFDYEEIKAAAIRICQILNQQEGGSDE